MTGGDNVNGKESRADMYRIFSRIPISPRVHEYVERLISANNQIEILLTQCTYVYPLVRPSANKMSSYFVSGIVLHSTTSSGAWDRWKWKYKFSLFPRRRPLRSAFKSTSLPDVNLRSSARYVNLLWIHLYIRYKKLTTEESFISYSQMHIYIINWYADW